MQVYTQVHTFIHKHTHRENNLDKHCASIWPEAWLLSDEQPALHAQWQLQVCSTVAGSTKRQNMANTSNCERTDPGEWAELFPYTLKSVWMLLPPFGQGEKLAWLLSGLPSTDDPHILVGNCNIPHRLKQRKGVVGHFPSSAGFFFLLTSSLICLCTMTAKGTSIGQILETMTHSLIIRSYHVTIHIDVEPCSWFHPARLVTIHATSSRRGWKAENLPWQVRSGCWRWCLGRRSFRLRRLMVAWNSAHPVPNAHVVQLPVQSTQKTLMPQANDTHKYA